MARFMLGGNAVPYAFADLTERSGNVGVEADKPDCKLIEYREVLSK